MNRRQLFEAAAGTGLLGVIGAALIRPDAISVQTEPHNSDAVLFAAIAAFNDAHDVYWRTVDQAPPKDDDAYFEATVAASDARQAAGTALAGIRPQTIVGHAARAACALRCARDFVPGDLDDSLSYLPPMLAAAILQDLAGVDVNTHLAPVGAA